MRIRRFVALLLVVALSIPPARGETMEGVDPSQIEAILKMAAGKIIFTEDFPHHRLVPGMTASDLRRFVLSTLKSDPTVGPGIRSWERRSVAREVLALGGVIDSAINQDAVSAVLADEELRKGNILDRTAARVLHPYQIGYLGKQKRADEFAERSIVRDALMEILSQDGESEIHTIGEAYGFLEKNRPPDIRADSISKWRNVWFRDGQQDLPHAILLGYGNLQRVIFGDGNALGRLTLGAPIPAEEVEKRMSLENIDRLWDAAARDLLTHGHWMDAKNIALSYFLEPTLTPIKAKERPASVLEIRMSGKVQNPTRELWKELQSSREEFTKEARYEIAVEAGRAIRSAAPEKRDEVRALFRMRLSPEGIKKHVDEVIGGAVKVAEEKAVEEERTHRILKTLYRDSVQETTFIPKERVARTLDLLNDILDPHGERGNMAEETKEMIESFVTPSAILSMAASMGLAMIVSKAAQAGVTKVTKWALAKALSKKIAETGRWRFARRMVTGAAKIGAFEATLSAIRTPMEGSAAWRDFDRKFLASLLMFRAIRSMGQLAAWPRSVILGNRAAARQGIKVARWWEPPTGLKATRAEGAVATSATTVVEGTGMALASYLDEKIEVIANLRDNEPFRFWENLTHALMTIVQLRIGNRGIQALIQANFHGKRTSPTPSEPVERKMAIAVGANTRVSAGSAAILPSRPRLVEQPRAESDSNRPNSEQLGLYKEGTGSSEPPKPPKPPEPPKVPAPKITTSSGERGKFEIELGEGHFKPGEKELSEAETTRALDALLRFFGGGKLTWASGIILFDIHGTLLDVNARLAKILRKVDHDSGKSYFEKFDFSASRGRLETLLEQAGVPEGERPAYVKAVMDHAFENLENDPIALVRGARDFLMRLRQMNVAWKYFTGVESRMEDVVRSALKASGLPAGDRVVSHKPTAAGEATPDFKARRVKELSAEKKLIVFEDDIASAVAIAKENPKVDVFWLDHGSPSESVPSDVPNIYRLRSLPRVSGPDTIQLRGSDGNNRALPFTEELKGRIVRGDSPATIVDLYVDPVTGLLNGRARSEEVRQGELPIAIDGIELKEFNNRHGDVAGDALLRTIGSVLASWFPDANVRSYRVHGDEFLVVLHGIGEWIGKQPSDLSPESMRRIIDARNRLELANQQIALTAVEFTDALGKKKQVFAPGFRAVMGLSDGNGSEMMGRAKKEGGPVVRQTGELLDVTGQAWASSPVFLWPTAERMTEVPKVESNVLAAELRSQGFKPSGTIAIELVNVHGDVQFAEVTAFGTKPGEEVYRLDGREYVGRRDFLNKMSVDMAVSRRVGTVYRNRYGQKFIHLTGPERLRVGGGGTGNVYFDPDGAVRKESRIAAGTGNGYARSKAEGLMTELINRVVPGLLPKIEIDGRAEPWFGPEFHQMIESGHASEIKVGEVVRVFEALEALEREGIAYRDNLVQNTIHGRGMVDPGVAILSEASPRVKDFRELEAKWRPRNVADMIFSRESFEVILEQQWDMARTMIFNIVAAGGPAELFADPVIQKRVGKLPSYVTKAVAEYERTVNPKGGEAEAWRVTWDSMVDDVMGRVGAQGVSRREAGNALVQILMAGDFKVGDTPIEAWIDHRATTHPAFPYRVIRNAMVELASHLLRSADPKERDRSIDDFSENRVVEGIADTPPTESGWKSAEGALGAILRAGGSRSTRFEAERKEEIVKATASEEGLRRTVELLGALTPQAVEGAIGPERSRTFYKNMWAMHRAIGLAEPLGRMARAGVPPGKLMEVLGGREFGPNEFLDLHVTLGGPDVSFGSLPLPVHNIHSALVGPPKGFLGTGVGGHRWARFVYPMDWRYEVWVVAGKNPKEWWSEFKLFHDRIWNSRISTLFSIEGVKWERGSVRAEGRILIRTFFLPVGTARVVREAGRYRIDKIDPKMSKQYVSALQREVSAPKSDILDGYFKFFSRDGRSITVGVSEGGKVLFPVLRTETLLQAIERAITMDRPKEQTRKGSDLLRDIQTHWGVIDKMATDSQNGPLFSGGINLDAGAARSLRKIADTLQNEIVEPLRDGRDLKNDPQLSRWEELLPSLRAARAKLLPMIKNFPRRATLPKEVKDALDNLADFLSYR